MLELRQNDETLKTVREGSRVVLPNGLGTVMPAVAGWTGPGSLELVEHVPAPAPPRTIDDARSEAKRRIERSYTAALSTVERAYLAQEREGWPEQVRGAEEVMAGGTSPLIDAMIAKTGETAQECAEAILAKRADYIALYGAATGRKRALMAQIAAATDVGTLAAIDIEAGWPGAD